MLFCRIFILEQDPEQQRKGGSQNLEGTIYQRHIWESAEKAPEGFVPSVGPHSLGTLVLFFLCVCLFLFLFLRQDFHVAIKPVL